MTNELMIKDLPTVDFTLRTTWNALVKSYNTEAQKFDMTMVMGFALYSVDPETGTASTALGPRMGMEPTSLSRTLKNLENIGFIERHPNPDDGRGVIIKLTKEGETYRAIATDVITQLNNRVVEEIGRKKIEVFHEVCKTIRKLVVNNKVYSD